MKGLFVMLLIPGIVCATLYRVGPTRALTNLQAVVSTLGPGDTVEVDGDTTYPGGMTFTQAGTSADPIVVRGIRINGRRPVISGGTNTVYFSTPYPYSGPGADHCVFEGFDITGGSFRGLFLQADSLLVRDVVVHDCPAHGILAADQGTGDITLEYVEVHHCGNGASQHQIYVTTDEVHYPGSVFRMRFCYLHDANGGNNVKSRSERNEIYYNWIEGAYYHELELIGPDPGGLEDLPQWSPGLKREDSDVMGNVLRKKRTTASNDTNFAVVRFGGDGTGATSGRYRFVNNTVVCGSGAVFRLFDSLESVEMHNNIFYRSAGVNVTRTVEALWASGSAVLAGSNNWVATGSSNVPAAWTGTQTGSTPGFLGIDDFRLGSGSACINQGIAMPQTISGHEFPSSAFPPAYEPPLRTAVLPGEEVARLQVDAIDMGAYEGAGSNVETGSHPKAQVRVTVVGNGCSGVEFITALRGDARLDIYDVRGRIVFVRHLSLHGNSQIVWNTRALGAGVYVARLSIGDTHQARRVIVLR
ncbi:MAG: hypothetical protein A2487_14585 [Candidatus Raymondbacteria bacterium RifOxyC12_full_50_8]|uniref:Secretion system C-terminal sorting domain-containing protein n=1 Tax=Candidatus Raymondbacteria bacterium RIFOXYD12_FULL_49_13 TaxID=1817890 RepID=A0A1F7F677_UNCRA|nr:MAG: hypothetical protein A2248_03535 [Candidatus Raymondbacteria bacterium RIFOXYA2_FULL_49_16]OGJ99650.1 MAG: hypothetical protein A2350_16190 [Candidatus Raymondbacteria bacterium RifOxyB12_full_50_8]OGK02141.1 MAG: hypothetical protein A2519_18950 [Candidatus Raymondbacteria bacterium RIFOXYD12_FULL_49_13]OGK06867.1 MAG: hypothetical protein A2487_14585 [Candidatus Raymondbacteria bacterium RifOxyC12_full_50_8]OGP42526.1 MAG: hypothetical protein A2324_17570 [Candidatus Raymondbacteria b